MQIFEYFTHPHPFIPKIVYNIIVYYVRTIKTILFIICTLSFYILSTPLSSFLSLSLSFGILVCCWTNPLVSMDETHLYTRVSLWSWTEVSWVTNFFSNFSRSKIIEIFEKDVIMDKYCVENTSWVIEKIKFAAHFALN